MIADLQFSPLDVAGIRRARFVPRPSIPLGAACMVANGIRETLRDLFGAHCDVRLGEPAALDRAAWDQLARDAVAFAIGGRQTDVIVLIPVMDASAIVQRAFGESEWSGPQPLSALELEALERIVTRCSATFDPLYAERRGPPQLLPSNRLPACVAFFDVRVTAPIAADIGIGIVRDLPNPGPAGLLPRRALDDVPLEVRVEFGHGTIDARTLLGLSPGDVIPLVTQVGAPGGLKIADTYIASGVTGISAGRYSFEIQTMREGARSEWRP